MSKSRRPVMAVVIAALAVLVLTVAAVWFFQRALIYFPDRTAAPPAATVLPGGREVVLATEDGLELAAWYLPPEPGCSAAVLVAPGNGGNRASRAPLARAIADRGLGVLLLDYRGYGGNPGDPSEHGLARDARAARSFLEREGFPVGSQVYLGESLGAAVAAELASDQPPAALVLRSPFSSLAEAGRAAYGVPVGWLLRDRFPVREHVGALSSPTAVVYGTADTIVPAEQSRAVARAAREAGNEVVEVAVAGAGHNDPELASGPELVDALVEVARRGGLTGCGQDRASSSTRAGARGTDP